MRLDKFVANNSAFSRSEVKALAHAGRLLVNGLPAKVSQHIRPRQDTISLDGETLTETQPLYLMLHKPVGYVCATHDSGHPTVIDLVQTAQQLPAHRLSELQIAGRLDIDTTGLILLTSDGQWNHRVTSPNSQCEKVYQVECAEVLDERLVGMFKEGILLKERGEQITTQPAKLEITGACSANLKIKQGLYHQVKRMFAACGNRVVKLHRSAVGELILDDSLPPGRVRSLSAVEIASFNI